MAGEQAIHNSQWSSCIFAPCRLRRPGVSPLRTSLRFVSSGLQPLRGLRRAALPPLSSAWSLCVFAPPCADACAVFRGCALRFAPCARHSSPSGLRCSQARLRLSLLHWAHRRLLQSLAAPPLSPSLGSSYRPALRWPGIPGLRTPFGRVLAPPPLRGFDGYGLFRALRAAKLRPHWAYYGLFPPQAAAFVRPF